MWTTHRQDKGWKISKSTVYWHLKEGTLKSIDGVFQIREVEKYAALHLTRMDGSSPAEEAGQLQKDKLAAETRKARAQAKHWEMKTQVESGQYIDFVVRVWAQDLTSWLIQYGTLSSWEDVERLVFNTRYPVQDSQESKGIFRAALDTGGGVNVDGDWTRTEEAYEWHRDNSRGVIFGIKGSSRTQFQKVEAKVMDKFPRSNKLIPGGLELRFLDTQQIKDLLHFRLTRKEAVPETGRKADQQRFYLHSETDVQYAKQFLAEEKRRDKKTRKVTWQQIGGRDNHLLDCEVYAAACADSSWTPSIRYLAKIEEKIKTETKSKPAPRPETQGPRPAGNRNRPSWFDKR